MEKGMKKRSMSSRFDVPLSKLHSELIAERTARVQLEEKVARLENAGCGCPVRASGETRVASQHNAPPRGVAPLTTKSSHLRSSAGPPGAVVCTSHCWGMTCPSDPTASRATRVQARWTVFSRRANNPVRGRPGRGPHTARPVGRNQGVGRSGWG